MVDAVDFGRWLEDNFQKRDFIWVKLDIEGAEYPVLEKMIEDGTIEYVDQLYVEFHNVKVDVPEERDKAISRELAALGIPVRSGESGADGNWFR